MKRKILLTTLTATVVLSSCYYDVEEELYPPNNNNCNNPTTISYAQHVVPLLQSNGCLGCHSGGAPSGGINLSNHTAVKVRATDGKLYGAINHSPGFKPMPQGGNKMNACDIAKIKSWIDSGAPNN